MKTRTASSINQAAGHYINMKPPLVIFTLALICAVVSPARALDSNPVGADIWTPGVTNGFGNATQNQEVSWLQNFNGCLYAAVNTSGTGAQLFRTADLTNWTAVGPALGSATNKINRMTANGSSDLYFSASADSGSLPVLYHSTDGINWTLISTTANGYTNTAAGSFSGLAVSGTNIYVAFISASSAAQIWRANLDGSNFKKKADFSTGLNIDTGANTNLNFISYLYAAANGTVYAGLAKRGAGSDTAPVDGYLYLYEANTTTASLTLNTGVGNGFGNAHNRNLACLTEFGGYLYASVDNPTTGGELWRTPFNAGNSFNDTVWQPVLAGGIDDRLNYELHHLSADNGYLWLVTMGVAPAGFVTNSPDEVWRSSDGVKWVQSNAAGFGDATNGISRYPAIAGFGSREVFGGRHLINGAQILVATAPPPTPAITATPNGMMNVNWSATATHVTLEAAADLTAAWNPATNAVQMSNGLFSIQFTPAQRRQFFRLKR
jgi:hypothetical protein